MVKAYLRYRAHDTFGLVASPTCKVAAHPHEPVLFTCANEAILQWDIHEGAVVAKLLPPQQETLASLTALLLSLSNPNLLVAAYADGKIRVWDYAAQRVTHTFVGHKSAISLLTQSLDGVYLASGGNDHDIVIWDTFNAEGRFRLSGHTQPVTGLAFLYDKESESGRGCILNTSPKYLLSAGLDGMLKLWDLEQQSCVQTISTHSTGSVHSLLLTPSQSHVVVGLAGSSIEIYEVKKCEQGDSASAGAYALSFSGVLTRADASHKVADLLFLGCPKGRPEEEGEFRLLPDGSFLKADGRRLFVPDQKGFILVSSYGRALEVIESVDKKGQGRREFRILLRRIEKLKRKRNKLEANTELDKDLTNLLGAQWRSTQAQGEKVKLASIEKGLTLLRNLLAEKRTPKKKRLKDAEDEDDAEDDAEAIEPISSAAVNFRMIPRKFDLIAKSVFLAAGQSSQKVATLFVSTAANTVEKYSLDKSAFFDIEKPSEIPLLQTAATSRTVMGSYDSLSEPATSIIVSNDDRALLTLCSGSVDVWDILTKKCRLRLNSTTTSVKKAYKPLCALFLAGDKNVIVGDADGDLSIFHLSTVTRVHREIEAHETAIQQIANSPDHTRIASVGADKKLKLWRLQLNAESNELGLDELMSVELPDKPLDVKFSFDGKMIGVALHDHTCLLFYADTLKLHLTFYGHTLPVTSIAFSTDGQFMASGSVDKHVKIWDTEFGNILRSLPIGREGFVTGVKFVFDTHYLICACSDGVVRLFDCDKGDRITNLTAGVASFRALATTMDAELIFAAASDRSIKVWERTDEQLFLSEEREREEEATRADVSLPGAASRQIVMDTRATKKDIEAVRCIERLVQVVEEATQEKMNQMGYKAALTEWESNPLKASLPKPPRPTPMLELLGRSPQQHIAAALLTLPTETQTEILLGLPQKTALTILEFSASSLSAVAELIDSEKNIAPLMLSSAETSIKVCLTLIHSHKNFLASQRQADTWMIDLNKAVKKILSFDLALNRRNAVALAFIASGSDPRRTPSTTTSA